MHLCILQHNLFKTPPITLRSTLTPSARNPCTLTPAPANLWSVSSLVLPLLGISYKWCHTIWSLLCLAFVHLTWYFQELSTLLHVSITHLLLLIISIILLCGYMYVSHFISQLYVGGDLLDQVISVCLAFQQMLQMLPSGCAILYSKQPWVRLSLSF